MKSKVNFEFCSICNDAICEFQVLKNCDELFGLHEEFAAIPNAGTDADNRQQFDTSFFVLRPNFNTLKCMVKDLASLNNNNNRK